MALKALSLTHKRVIPTGAESAFWEPPQIMSILPASTSIASANMLETESTTESMPCESSSLQIFSISLSTPLGVSQ